MIVNVYVPVVVLEVVVMVSVDVKVGLPEGGPKLGLAPLGKPLTLKETACVGG